MLPVKRLISSQGTEGFAIRAKRGTFAMANVKDRLKVGTTY